MISILYDPISPVLSDNIREFDRKVILFDPTEIYTRININPYERKQTLDVQKMWPNSEPGKCACGCGTVLTGRQTRWAGETHSKFPIQVFHILRGDLDVILYYLTKFLPHCCCRCEKKHSVNANFYSDLQVDHVLAVMNGGGGAWLGNYQILCTKCHGRKSSEDKADKKRRLLQLSPHLFNK